MSESPEFQQLVDDFVCSGIYSSDDVVKLMKLAYEKGMNVVLREVIEKLNESPHTKVGE